MERKMNIKRGIDRLSIAVAVILMVVFSVIIVIIAADQGFPSLARMLVTILGGAVVIVLLALYGIRGIAAVVLWIIEGFKEEPRKK
jgi:hypothetical protein